MRIAVVCGAQVYRECAQVTRTGKEFRAGNLKFKPHRQRPR